MTPRIGIVGLGRISTLHVDAYMAMGDEVDVAAVCDIDDQRAAAVAASTGAEIATFDEIIGDDAIDAVEILVPSHSQAELARRALAAGKHVTVQKPLAGDLGTAADLVALATKAGVHFRVFENTVNAPSWRFAEQLIAEGAIGQPLSIYLRWANSLLSSGWEVPRDAWEWRRRGPWAEQFAAPSLFDDSAHLLSPAIALFGEVARVVALSGDQQVGGRSTGFPYSIAWHHSEGGQAVVEGTLCNELVVLTEQYSADTSITITGTSGLLWINTGEGRAAPRPTVELARGGELRTYDVDHRWAASWLVAQREWVASLRGEGTFRWTGEQALSVLRGSLLVDDAIRASRDAR